MYFAWIPLWSVRPFCIELINPVVKLFKYTSAITSIWTCFNIPPNSVTGFVVHFELLSQRWRFIFCLLIYKVIALSLLTEEHKLCLYGKWKFTGKLFCVVLLRGDNTWPTFVLKEFVSFAPRLIYLLKRHVYRTNQNACVKKMLYVDL